ncbi:MAG: site-specific DNA-methyltransferase [Verrucomicrobia bacterium]|nr:MAG: site-specific DNA-methyltransferase [Verrucomicrobiota bacterium]TAE88173.1 MAG: site-specific DNA-methyltransferase [Verrucomicrobiota bacterium]TAF26057.1 MAG: site-specific DNA-methyltransferase [Verrucomicrobiota bacterium]TAF41018.1 MAG: site-specific DNA-methyltransferase [Verrucomicrobiota bacterium]
MSAFSDLRKKLAELFQLDAAAELDFGIYRILNARRVEIEGFLDSLEPQVEAILAEALQCGAADLKAELEKVEAGLRAGGFDEAMIATAPKVKELREKIAESGDDPAAITHEIFSLLTTFFSRYYKDGDFISLRRYKKDTYAIPYEGEEVKLHWANADQYYIKSSESFRDYTFRLGPAPKDDKPDQRPAVTFKLVEADIEKDNNKAVAGQERRFVFTGTADLQSASSSEILVLGFTYAPVGKKEKQADLNAAAAEQILADHAKGAFTALAANDPTYTVKGKSRTILAKHLAEYTGKNSFDYFIHKDLGGFLRRELDFFIKNEVVHLDDLDDAPETHWREVRAKLKALRQIAGKITRFLAQIEDFQKKLWLKKKFVTACDYVVTLDRIPEELYPEIAACDAQREEWVRLFAIDEIKGDLGRAGYSVPLTVEFLRENRCLPLDSQNLSTGAKQNLSSVVYEVDGLAWNSENFQAPNLLNRRYRGDVSMIYADPPYNTGSDGFAYKDNFQHSSWLSMLSQRLPILRQLLAGDSALFLSLDDAELYRAICLLEQAFSGDGHLATFARRTKSGGGSAADAFAVEHDYVVAWAKNKSSCRKFFINHDPEYLKRYSESDEDGPYFWDTMERSSTATKPYPIEAPDGTILRGKWFRSEDRFKNDLLKGDARIVKVAGEKWSVQFKQRLAPGRKLRSLMAESEFRSQPKDLGDLGLGDSFPYPKTLFLLEKLIECATFSDSKRGSILDPFAGSGTTGHAVINLNREDGGDRKYILIEMGEHFDTVLVPRLKKVIYSKDWKDGKPQSRNTGISHCFKILRLESYEDTLNNLRLHRSREQELALEAFSPTAKEDYQLGYMLDLEAKGSQSLLNVSAFIDPWNYTLEIASGTAGETKTTKVDLVETFHWLLGLTVLAQGRGEGVHWTEGTNPEGEKVLVLWRNTSEVDAEALNAWCRKQKISVLDGEFSLIYVNGDHHLENLRREDQTWKVRLIDEEFPKLMWEGCE